MSRLTRQKKRQRKARRQRRGVVIHRLMAFYGPFPKERFRDKRVTLLVADLMRPGILENVFRSSLFPSRLFHARDCV